MTQENPSSDQLQEALSGLSMTQIRFCIARLEHKSDKDAAKSIGIAEQTVYSWDNKAQVRDAVDLMRYDGMITALEIRRRNLAKAMAVKAAGLESDDEKIRQNVATELIEWELGKAQQKTEITGNVNSKVEIVPYDYKDAIAQITSRPEQNSNPPGESQGAGDGAQVGQNDDDG